MKKLNFGVLIFLCCAGFVSCGDEENEEIGGDPVSSVIEVITGEASNITDTGATIAGEIKGMSGYTEGNRWGVCYNTVGAPEMENAKHVSTTTVSEGTFTVAITGLTAHTKYYYRAYVLSGGTYYYGTSRSFTTLIHDDGNDIPTAGDAIDLGLSVKWSSCNIGATKPEEFGGLYGWGDATGACTAQAGNKMDGNYMDEAACYALYGGNNPPLSICGTELDIAHIKRGGNWRLPTSKQADELREKCRWKTVTYNGVLGRLAIGPNGNKIFLPAGGVRNGTKISKQGIRGTYWTGTLCQPTQVEPLQNKKAYGFGFEEYVIPLATKDSRVLRYIGCRFVRSASKKIQLLFTYKNT